MDAELDQARDKACLAEAETEKESVRLQRAERAHQVLQNRLQAVFGRSALNSREQAIMDKLAEIKQRYSTVLQTFIAENAPEMRKAMDAKYEHMEEMLARVRTEILDSDLRSNVRDALSLEYQREAEAIKIACNRQLDQLVHGQLAQYEDAQIACNEALDGFESLHKGFEALEIQCKEIDSTKRDRLDAQADREATKKDRAVAMEYYKDACAEQRCLDERKIEDKIETAKAALTVTVMAEQQRQQRELNEGRAQVDADQKTVHAERDALRVKEASFQADQESWKAERKALQVDSESWKAEREALTAERTKLQTLLENFASADNRKREEVQSEVVQSWRELHQQKCADTAALQQRLDTSERSLATAQHDVSQLRQTLDSERLTNKTAQAQVALTLETERADSKATLKAESAAKQRKLDEAQITLQQERLIKDRESGVLQRQIEGLEAELQAERESAQAALRDQRLELEQAQARRCGRAQAPGSAFRDCAAASQSSGRARIRGRPKCLAGPGSRARRTGDASHPLAHAAAGLWPTGRDGEHADGLWGAACMASFPCLLPLPSGPLPTSAAPMLHVCADEVAPGRRD